jgi:Replicative DNA helicase
MESPTVQITQRLIAAHSGVNMGNIVRGEFDPYQFEKVSNTIATLKNSNFIITDKGSLSPSDMRQLLRRISREHGGIGMVLADYVQLMKLHDAQKKTRNDELKRD